MLSRLLTISFFLVVFASSYAQKTDTIVHINGNILTGEIKRLNFGIVTFKMDGMGTINYELDKIQTIRSKKYFEIRLSNGLYYFGTIDTSNQLRKVKIVLSERAELINVNELIELYPIKQNFWQRITGKFDAGFDFSKGSGIGKLSFNGLLDYRRKKSYFEINWSNNTTIQGDSVSAAKADWLFNYQRYLIKKWSLSLETGVNENSELGLDLRLYVTASGIWDIIHNNRHRFYVGAGLSTNREWTNGDTTALNNLEAVATISYRMFRYISPKVDINTGLNVLPSLTSKGRIRFDYILKCKVEVFNDFYVGVNYYYTFDSKPTSAVAAKEDWGIAMTIGYSFH